MKEKKDNPFMIVCKFCGDILCYKCAQYEDRLNEISEDETGRKTKRVYEAWDKHKAKYLHNIDTSAREDTDEEDARAMLDVARP